MVSPNDHLWIIGDLAYKCSADYISRFLHSINGTFHVICGNHDKPFREACERGMMDDLFKSGKLEVIGGKEAIEDHTLSISKMLEIEGQRVYISHYAHRTWPNSFRGSIHIFAHSHSNLPNFYKSMDVGVDTFTETHQRFYPWTWDEIKANMEKVKEEFKEKENEIQSNVENG